jgi:hypothetical protein
MQRYREISRDFGLYDGPIDGWFAIYRRTVLRACGTLRPSRYHAIGCEVKNRLSAMGHSGLLCTRLKVFHVTGPAYASYFGMLDFELAKYSSLGRQDVVNWYLGERSKLPPRDELALRVRQIQKNLAETP